jgi:hypothetical protein
MKQTFTNGCYPAKAGVYDFDIDGLNPNYYYFLIQFHLYSFVGKGGHLKPSSQVQRRE